MESFMLQQLKMKNKENKEKDYPSRLGQPWLLEEHNQLIEELQNQKSIREIAEKHNRTEGGIKARIKLIIKQFHEKGKTAQEISDIFSLSLKEVEELIYKQNKEIIKDDRETCSDFNIESKNIARELQKLNDNLSKLIEKI